MTTSHYVLTQGNILTMDKDGTMARAIAVEGGRIRQVGSVPH